MKGKCNFIKKCLSFVLSLLILLSPVLTSVSSAQTSSTTSAKSGDYLYYSVYNKLYKINTKTKKKQLVLYNKSWWSIDNILVHKGYIYCVIDTCYGTGEEYEYIYKVKTNGTNGKVLDKGRNLIVCGDKLYYKKIDFDKNDFDDTFKIYGIYSMNLDGSNKKAIKSSSDIYDFKIYKSNIYYKTSKNIYKIDLKGKNNKKIMDADDKDIFAIYQGNIYYNKFNYDKKTDNIYKFNLKTKKSTKVMSNALGFDVSNGYVYYTKNKENTIVSIYRMKISTNKKYLLTSKKFFIQASKEGDYIVYYSPGPSEQKNTRLSIIRCDGKNNMNLADFYVS